MKTTIIPKVIGLICASIMASIANTSFTISDEISDNFIKLGYKPVPDTCPYVEEDGRLNDNFIYKEWCEETFENGNYIYEAYKDIAFNIKYTSELSKTDFWQTPVETTRLKKGDCEDAVFLFFSHLLPYQKNAKIVWGWIFDKRSINGRKHVWYQLVDHKGQQYVVEGFSKDWNGIIPMEMLEKIELRMPILKIAHSKVSRLAGSLPKADDSQIIRSLIDLFTAANISKHDSGRQHSLQNMQNQLPPNMNKEISYISNKLYELFSRFEGHKEEANMQVGYKSNMKKPHPDRNPMYRR